MTNGSRIKAEHVDRTAYNHKKWRKDHVLRAIHVESTVHNRQKLQSDLVLTAVQFNILTVKYDNPTAYTAENYEWIVFIGQKWRLNTKVCHFKQLLKYKPDY